MMKSDIDIAKFVYHKIKGSSLESDITGKLSDRGRPNKSDREDIVISVLANEGCGQIQRAYVNVNVFMLGTNGMLEQRHGKRIPNVSVNYANYASSFFLYGKMSIILCLRNAVRKPIQQVFLLRMDTRNISSTTNCILK